MVADNVARLKRIVEEVWRWRPAGAATTRIDARSKWLRQGRLGAYLGADRRRRRAAALDLPVTPLRASVRCRTTCAACW